MTKYIFSYKRISHLVCLLLFLVSTLSIQAQVITVNNAADTESGFSPEELIRNVLIDGNCADVRNISTNLNIADPGSSQHPSNTNNKSYGYFKGNSRFPFSEGLIISTGSAFQAGNTAIAPANPLGVDVGTGSDPDLVTATGNQDLYTNAVYIEFDFVPVSNTISFRYVMASEEYSPSNSFPCPDPTTGQVFADSFAFLLRQEGSTNFENIALIPTTGEPVSVENIRNNSSCPPKNEEFYAGDISSTPPVADTNYDGRTVALTATATVTPGVVYRIKLVIADYVDSSYDSAVFLEAGSFNLGLDLGDDFVTADNSAVCGNSIPLTANITANSYQWLKDGVPIPGATNQTYSAN